MTFWPGTGERLKIINGEDFSRNEILEGLGLNTSPLVSTFGITDEQAIKERLEISEYILANPEVSEFFRKTHFDDKLPSNEKAFMLCFPQKRRAKFWTNIEQFVKLVNESSNPPARITELAAHMATMLPHEPREREMTSRIVAKSSGPTTVLGVKCL